MPTICVPVKSQKLCACKIQYQDSFTVHMPIMNMNKLKEKCVRSKTQGDKYHGIQNLENNHLGSVSHLPSPPWWQHCPYSSRWESLSRKFCCTGVLLSVPAPRLAPDLLRENILPQLQDISISISLYLYLYIFLNYQIIWEVDTISQFLILTLFPIFTLVVRNKNVWNQNLRKGKKGGSRVNNEEEPESVDHFAQYFRGDFVC